MGIRASLDVVAEATAHWTRVGLRAHASKGAFARFRMHLLALGAPPELVRDTLEAIGEETEHARLAFGLASSFAGRPVGRGAAANETIGPLSNGGALDGFGLRKFVATLVREGCIGETVAAIEARDALEHVTDPAVRAVLETIAGDELRHAALAWRTLGWVVASGRADRALVYEEVLRAVREVRPRPQVLDDEEALLPLGVVSETRREELRLMTLSSIIGRCATGVIAVPRGPIGDTTQAC